MKTTLKSMIGFAFVAVFILSILSFTAPNKISDDWAVPDKYQNMKNPYAGEGDEDDIGKDLYKQHAELETEMREFGSADVQGQSDGALFYKGVVGKDEMPNFEKKIRDDEDQWMLINYLRTLAE